MYVIYSVKEKRTGNFLVYIFTDTFRAAAEANSDDILKLYNTKGNLINISPKLPENTPDTRYKLEVVALHCNGKNIKSRWLICVIECLKRRGTPPYSDVHCTLI